MFKIVFVSLQLEGLKLCWFNCSCGAQNYVSLIAIIGGLKFVLVYLQLEGSKFCWFLRKILH